MEDIEKEIEAEFCDVGIDVEGNLAIVEKLKSMCVTYELTPGDLVAKWFTFSAQKNDCELTLDVLDDFNKSVAKTSSTAKKGKRQSNQTSQPVIYDMNSIESCIREQEEEEDMLLGYAKTPQSKGVGKRLHTTPDELTNKRIASMSRTPATKMFSPASFSPNVAPSPKYESRQSIGDVVASYPQSLGANRQWQGTKNNIRIRSYSEKSHLKQPYKYMYETLSDKADVLDWLLEEISQSMKTAFNLDEFTPVTHTDQEKFLVCGRVCCDAMGKLNPKSILLEGSRDQSNGERITFDPSELQNFSLFPGQVIAAKGIKSGSTFIASEVYDGVRSPFNSTMYKDKVINDDDFIVYVACGPFVTSDTLSHAPLVDFLSIVEAERPDLIIMLGPFVDCKIPSIENAEVDFSFEDKFTEYKNLILASALRAGSKVVFLPSQRDVCHHFVYPQPPLEISELQNERSDKVKERVLSVADPSTLSVNDVVFGVTSTDILFHLGSEEAYSFALGTSDRLGRLCSHLLKQQNYYPLQPPSEDVNIDYTHFEQYSTMQVSPDVLILPSDLRFFVKEVDGCLCINPGRLVKGQTGGTYAKLHVKPSKISNSDKSITLAKTVVHIVKI